MKRIDLIMAANVQTALATRIQELSTTFRKKQANYLRRESFLVCLAPRGGGNTLRRRIRLFACRRTDGSRRHTHSELKGNEDRAVEMQAKAAYDPLFALAEDEQTVGLRRHVLLGLHGATPPLKAA